MFHRRDACELFLGYLAEMPEEYGLRIHGYALMPNHYHLMVESRYGRLSEGMQWLGGRFVQHINARRGWDGMVFRGRFQNRCVEDEAYWRHLLVYLHLNPVRAGMARTAARARWTSHRAYVHGGPAWLRRDELLDLHGGVEGYLAYLGDAGVGRDGPSTFDPDHLFEASRRNALRRECARLAERGLGTAAIAREIGRSRNLVRTLLVRE